MEALLREILQEVRDIKAEQFESKQQLLSLTSSLEGFSVFTNGGSGNVASAKKRTTKPKAAPKKAAEKKQDTSAEDAEVSSQTEKESNTSEEKKKTKKPAMKKSPAKTTTVEDNVLVYFKTNYSDDGDDKFNEAFPQGVRSNILDSNRAKFKNLRGKTRKAMIDNLYCEYIDNTPDVKEAIQALMEEDE